MDLPSAGGTLIMFTMFKKVQYCNNIIHCIPRVPSKAWQSQETMHILTYSTAKMLNMSGHIKPDPVKFWHRSLIGTNNISGHPFSSGTGIVLNHSLLPLALAKKG